MKTLLALFFYGSVCLAGQPDWFDEPSKVTDERIEISCLGEGISHHLSRQSAIEACNGSLSNFLSNEVKVESLSVQTERSASLHEKVSSNLKIKSAICVPIKEKDMKDDDGSHTYFIRCSFDRNQIQVTGFENQEQPTAVERFNQFSIIKRDPSSWTLNVASIPICSDILIVGKKARSILCESNPTTIVLYDDDIKLIVRKDGFRPKEIDLQSAVKKDGVIHVKMEK